MKTNLKELVREEFGGENAQRLYMEKAKEGLWLSESFIIDKYFTKRDAKVLDIGCGTGRTTIPLYEVGFSITGIDFVPKMIENAKKISDELNLPIDYRVGDATDIEFADNYFDYVLFSNNGWTQIPGRENRLRALNEVYRVLKPDGIFIFTAHPRVWSRQFLLFWTVQWLRFFLLKPMGFHIEELDFGDRFFDRETHDNQKTYKTQQYIHIPTRQEVEREIDKAGFKLVEVNECLQASTTDTTPYPPVFYVCQK